MDEPMDAAKETGTREQEEWDDGEEYEEEEDDEDIDKEAQEIARRLGEQLWADISKVNAEREAAAAAVTSTAAMLTPTPDATMGTTPIASTLTSVIASQNRKKEDAILATMKTVLALVEKDPQANAALLSATVPDGHNVLELLYQCTSSGNISKRLAGPLSHIVVSLAKSEVLFGNLRQSNAPAIQLDIGKRKREAFDEGHLIHPHPYKRPYVQDSDLQHQVVDAVRIISQALGSSPSQTLDPSVVSPIRLQLHQVFLFAVTSAPVSGPNIHALQEIGGLIQVIGVLSGIQIGHSPPDALPAPPPFPPGYPWASQQQPSMATDIGTAVYPCLFAGCGKTLSRLYSLRAHQRSHSSHRPYRCNVCPASFARNHDLKRHVKLHDQKAWKCQGCGKVFSRRDAIKRHKNGTKNRGPKSEICLVADVIEVQLEGAEEEAAQREERRAKLWSGIAVNEASGVAAASGGSDPFGTVDEGEINPAVILSIQAAVLNLHGLLQALVGNALGNPLGHAPSMAVDPSAGQATLASVIARAQSHTLPSVPPAFQSQSAVGQSSPTSQNADVPFGEGISAHPQSGVEIAEGHQPLPSLSMYGLSDEQTKLLELAIANAASAAQAQAEAEAAIEEEEEENDDEEEEDDESEMEQDKTEKTIPPVTE